LYFGILSRFNEFFKNDFIFTINDFHYFFENSELVGFYQYKKHYIRDYFLNNIV
jgi:hypothetical protein